MGTAALARMVGASVLGWIALAAVAGSDGLLAVTVGTLGPLVATVVSWLAIVRIHAQAPGKVQGAMLRFFGAKMVFFAVFVTAAVMRLSLGTRIFVVSFVTQYIMLHFMEACYLHRLFTGRRRASASISSVCCSTKFSTPPRLPPEKFDAGEVIIEHVSNSASTIR